MDLLQGWTKTVFYDKADPRMRDLPLMGNPLPVTLITGTWLYFVLKVGPRYMADRKPMSLKSFVQAVNLSQIIFNSFLVYEFLDAGWLNGYTFRCQLVDYSMDHNALRMARACYIYMILKMYDFIDTIIFVLRRKDNQVSFLHVYHHVVTLFMSYLIVSFGPGGLLTFGTAMNSIVHVLMYIYYFVAALGPEYQKYLWWKKYLTRIQLVQFILQILAGFDAMLRKDCHYQPMVTVYICVTGLFTLFLLFVQFYTKTYQDKKKVKDAL